MTTRTISINRAPVVTLWAAVVAQRLGFDEDEALTLGKAVAGLNAQAKGRRLGIFKPHEEKAKKAREKERGERFLIEVLGRPVPATNTDDGIRAVHGRNPMQLLRAVRQYRSAWPQATSSLLLGQGLGHGPAPLEDQAPRCATTSSPCRTDRCGPERR